MTWIDRFPRFLLLLGAGLFVVSSVAAFSPEIGNNDIAGITYNADVILDGKLPFRDSVEFKSPAPYFLFAGIFKFISRDLRAVRVIFALWMILGAFGVWAAASAFTSNRTSRSLATALYLASAAQFDVNYSSWMTPPYTWAFAALLFGQRTNRTAWHLAAGAAAMLAFLFKVQAALLVPIFPLVWAVGRSRRDPGAHFGAPLYWIAGGLLAALPLVMVYAVQNALGDLFRQLFPVWAFVEHVTPPAVPIYLVVWRVLVQLWSFFPVASSGAAVAVIGVWYFPREERVGFLEAAIFTLLSIAAGGLGGPRFYGHYFIQFLPGLALLAGHPVGLAGHAARAARMPWAAGAVGLGCAIGLGLQSLKFSQPESTPLRMVPALNPQGKSAARLAGEHIRARTAPGDTVHCWGWHAWPVYYWSQRFAPTPMYKELGLVTVVNTNTYWSPSKPMPFRSGRWAEMLLKAFQENPPAYFVYSPYYMFQANSTIEPLQQFEALSKILQEQYVPEAKFDDLQLYVRKDRLSASVRPAR